MNVLFIRLACKGWFCFCEESISELLALSVGIMPHLEEKKVEGVNFLLAFMNIIKERGSMFLKKVDSFFLFSQRT